MNKRCWELVTADEPTVVTEPSLDVVVVENGQGNGSLPDAAGTNESNWREILSEANDLQEQVITSQTT
jgi:hypothetical protein